MSFLAVALSGLGLFGIQYSNDRLQTVYVDRLVPLKDLKIIELMGQSLRSDVLMVDKK
jgi:hypothetical protein